MEYICRILLRRQNNNNFIFQLNRFDDIDEIIIKYKIKVPEYFKPVIEFMKKEWNRCDLIEFIFDNKINRKIIDLNFYEVKSKIYYVKRNYFEQCLSNYKFMNKIKNEFNLKTYIISVFVYDSWRFSFNIISYENQKIRVYSRFNKTTSSSYLNKLQKK